MTRSMTGYGRATAPIAEGLDWVVEVHSVNRKMLDIHMHLPKELLFLDVDFRKVLGKVLSRGLVTLRISPSKSGKQTVPISQLKILKGEWEGVASELGYENFSVDLPFLLRQLESGPGFAIDQESPGALTKALKDALASLVEMKEKEGNVLATDISARVETLSSLLAKIEKLAPGASDKQREKLLERLEEILPGSGDDERLLKEIALYAEKVDVTEEITRLKSHFAQANGLLDSKEKSVGRTFDFLIQEMLREINTIASKTPNLEVTQSTVAMKSELEKIREQVQNIE